MWNAIRFEGITPYSSNGNKERVTNLTLQRVNQQLSAAITAHSAACTQEPVFRVDSLGDQQMLIMSCPKCSTLQVIV